MHQLFRHLTPGRWRQDFRFKASLIAAFFSAKSASMRLSLAFSASSSSPLRLGNMNTRVLSLPEVVRNVAMPCLWHRSTTGIPASPSFKTATIWLSVNLLFFRGGSPTHGGSETLPADVYSEGDLTVCLKCMPFPNFARSRNGQRCGPRCCRFGEAQQSLD